MSFGGSAEQQMMAQQMSFALISAMMNNCFDDCKPDFNSAEYSQGERTCLINCATRNAHGQKLVQEVQQEMQAKMQGGGFQ